MGAQTRCHTCSPVAAGPMSCRRVLSVQSHVVHGYVGNKSAVFPLQLHGFEVDPVNSVQFSNHTGYKNGFKGEVLGGEQLTALVSGLEQNSLLQYSHLLTGYIGSVSFLRSVIDTVHKLKEANPDLIYVCDPVMGDRGKLYVPEELVEVYREEMLSLATMLTPNQFEIQLLTGIDVVDEASAARACHFLHSKGVQIVVITSLEYPGLNESTLELFASYKVPGTDREEQHRLLLPKHPDDYTGCGDLMAALLLAHTHATPNDLPSAIERAAASMQAVIGATAAGPPNPSGGMRELQLVSCKRQIEAPEVTCRAVQIESCQSELPHGSPFLGPQPSTPDGRATSECIAGLEL